MKKLLAILAGASVGFALLATPVAAQTIPSGPWGSINYWGVSGASQVLQPGTAGYCLETQGVGSAPLWIACPGSALNLLPGINTNQFYGNVSGQFAPPVGVDVNTILNTVGYDISRPPAVESILYKSNVGPSFNWQTLPPGTTGSLLTSGGPFNPPFWSPTATQANLASICQTVGALLYFDTPSNLWKCLAPGTSGQVLETGGAGANPSWLTVTLATLGGVASTRNINTSAPLSGGGALSSDLTLTCTTCLVNGGPLGTPSSGTLTNATGLPLSTGVTGTLSVSLGGTGGGTASGTLLDNITGFASTGYINRTGAGAYSFNPAATGANYFAGAASKVVESGVIYQAETTTTFGATTTFDFSTFINTAVTLTGNITTMSVANVTPGKAGTITFVQDATGSRTTVWNSAFKFAGGVTPTLSTAANAVDVLSYSCRSATFCVASLIKAVQ